MCTQQPSMFSQPVVAEEGDIWPPNTHDLSSTEGTKTLSNDQDNPKYIDRPTKRWPHTVILISNPILSREIMHQRLITPWLRTIKDDRERIKSISYFAGKIKIHFVGNNYVKQFADFVDKHCDKSGISVTCRVYHHIDSEDRKDFERKYGCRILFLLKSRKSGALIPRSVAKAAVDVRDQLTSRRCFFQATEIKFIANDISNYDDYHYPRCNRCQKLGHWAQKCPMKRNICPFCAEEHCNENCPKTIRGCANCGQTGHRAFAKSCSEFKKYVLWAQRKEMDIVNQGTAWNNHTSSSHSKVPSLPRKEAPVGLLSFEDVTEISPNDLDNKLEQFGARILKITMATGSHVPQKRVRRPLRTTSDFNSSATDIEIDDNEEYVRAIIAEQSTSGKVSKRHEIGAVEFRRANRPSQTIP
ncbi:hypothetical protein ACOME3_003748 [Neoechinorhynchus agilis]